MYVNHIYLLPVVSYPRSRSRRAETPSPTSKGRSSAHGPVAFLRTWKIITDPGKGRKHWFSKEVGPFENGRNYHKSTASIIICQNCRPKLIIGGFVDQKIIRQHNLCFLNEHMYVVLCSLSDGKVLTDPKKRCWRNVFIKPLYVEWSRQWVKKEGKTCQTHLRAEVTWWWSLNWQWVS